MNDTFGEKIKNARKLKGWTQRQLASMVKSSHNSVSDWENNKAKPDPDTIELLCGALDVTPSFLLSNSEEEFTPNEKLLVKKYRSLDDSGREFVELIIDREAQRREEIEKAEKERVPVRVMAYIGKIAAAGVPVDSFSIFSMDTKEIPDTPESRMADFAIGVSGDSMEPDFYDGDTALVKMVRRVEVGEIGIFQKENGLWIKRCTENGLRSINSKYEDMIDEQEVLCIGKVVGKVER